MTQDTEIELQTGTAGPELRKRARTDRGRERIAREVARLTAANHPGVVPLLRHDEGSLTLGWAGGQTLETHTPDLAGAAALLASLASTVADLHGLGIVHGRIEASHVVIDPEGRPRLGGLRGLDDDEHPALPTDDVAALGALLERLVGPGSELEPIPERRWARRRWLGYQRRSLQTLADQATDPDPARRPTARELAASVADAVPDAAFHLATPVEPVAPPPSPPPAPDADVAPHVETSGTRADGWTPIDPPVPPPPPAGDEAPNRAGDDAVPSSSPRFTPRTVGGPIDEAHVAVDTGPPTFLAQPDLAPTTDAEDDHRFLGMRVDPDQPVRPLEPASDVPLDERPRIEDLLRPAADPVRPLGRRPVVVAAAGLVAAIVLVTALAARRTTAPPREAAASDAATTIAAVAPSTTADPTDAATGSTTTGSAVPTTEPRMCAATGAPAGAGPDIDGDGCPDPVTVDGGRVTTATARYLVGDAGDHVAVADWDCDGIATVGLVRPSTGEVFTFPDWNVTAGPTTVRSAAVVSGAVDLVPPTPSDGTCDLTVRRVDGSVASVPTVPVP